MAAKANGSSSSCLSFLKDALLLPTQNPKLFVPLFLLIAVSTFLLQITGVLFLPSSEINSTDSSSFNYAKLREILKEDTGSIKITMSVVITISVIISIFFFVIIAGLAVQIVPIFAASSTYSGDHYSLPELFSKVIMKGRRLRGPLITLLLVTVLDIVCKLPVSALSLAVMPRFYMAALSAFQLFVFLYLDVVFVVAIAASVADTKRRGVSALLQAWQLMTRVWRKEGFVLVVVHFLLMKVPLSPLHGVALAYTKKSMPMGLALLAVHQLLSDLTGSFYFTAATVYCYQAMKTMKNMVEMAP